MGRLDTPCVQHCCKYSCTNRYIYLKWLLIRKLIKNNNGLLSGKSSVTICISLWRQLRLTGAPTSLHVHMPVQPIIYLFFNVSFTVHTCNTKCTSTLSQHSPLQLQDSSTCLSWFRLLLSSFLELFIVIMPYMYTCTRMFTYIIISINTSFLHVFDARFWHYMYTCF